MEIESNQKIRYNYLNININNTGKEIVKIVASGIDPIVGITASVGLEIYNDVIRRQLSKVEEIKINDIHGYIIDSINKKLSNGEEIISIQDNETLAWATQLYEGVLYKIKSEHEYKKMPFIANIYLSFLFEKELPALTCNNILKLAHNFSYEDLCYISLYGRKESLNWDIIMNSFMFDCLNGEFDNEFHRSLLVIFNLYNQGIITSEWLIPNYTHVKPSVFSLTPMGKLIYESMQLDQIQEADIKKTVNDISYKDKYGSDKNNRINGY